MQVRIFIAGFTTCFLGLLLGSCGRAVPADDLARPQVQGEVFEAQRPMIWVRRSERPALLAKIENNDAVRAYYAAFTARVEDELTAWEEDPTAYFNRLPLDRSAEIPGKTPPFKTYTAFGGKDGEEQDRLRYQLQTAIDCGVLYFLTEEERYARYAADVLHNFIVAVRQLPLETEFHNAGWIYTKDHLREAREIGAQIPIIYDFVQPWLAAGGTVYDLGKNRRIAFDFAAAEGVFRTYIDLAINRGGTGTNWPILEASSLVHNSLALDAPAEREKYLRYFLEESTHRQDALPKIAAFYDAYGGSWPESLGYSQHVGQFLTYLFTLLSHHDPGSQLVREYPQVVAALPEAYYLTYPGGKETLLFGDGHREYHPLLAGYEMAYHLGHREGDPELVNTFGPLINHSVDGGGYRRFDLSDERSFGATIYREPTTLLWYEAEVPQAAGEYPLPVTAELPFAGITLQRNLSPSGRTENGLMGFVGGGAYVHGHATGMSMELFGKGFVLGGKGGRSSYTTDIHENYYRLFASNNTVIVNGATTSDDGWAKLGTDRVRRLAAEPEPGATPVSPSFSFTTSAFRDTVGEGAEAYQERTLGIVRTTDSTGYYVDVFRSLSELEEQYHDYIYRNVGEDLELHADGEEMELTDAPDRFMANADAEWRQNRTYRQPGWHFFRDVATSGQTAASVVATFGARLLAGENIGMQVFLPGSEGRSYTTASSPPSTEGPHAYRERLTPTLVVRQQGEAWERPFAAVYEPVKGEGNSIATVAAIWRERRCEGMLVKSNERAGGITQLILAPTNPDEEMNLSEHDLSFRGRYAIVTLNAATEIVSIYIGEGQALTFAGYSVRSVGEQPISAFVDFREAEAKVTATGPVYLQQGDNEARKYTPDR